MSRIGFIFLFSFVSATIYGFDGNQLLQDGKLSKALDDFNTSLVITGHTVYGSSAGFQRNPRQVVPQKSYKAVTKRLRNGSKTTTLWYYNSNGPNFKFTIVGEPPVPNEEMIDWLEKNGNQYLVTPIPFMGDAEERLQRLPDSKPKPVPAPTPEKKITVTTAKPVSVMGDAEERPQRPPDLKPKPVPAPPPEKKITVTTAKAVPLMDDAEERPQRPPDLKPKPVPAPPPEKEITVTTTKTVVVTSSSAERYLPSECGLIGAQLVDKIVGGDTAEIEDTPWQVAILRRKGKSLACSGSIISSRHVVTATHCFRYKKKPDVDPTIINKEDRIVVAGAFSLKIEDWDEHAIDGIFLHASYIDDTLRNDIALLLITGKFTFGEKIFPICLPSKEEILYSGRLCKISGWGRNRIEAKTNLTERRVRSTEVKITKEDECKKEYQKILPITEGMVCAGNFGKVSKEACQGDSGGALACKESGKYTLFGVDSWGKGCAHTRYPGVYTRVPEYLRWITQAIEVSMVGQV